MKDYYRTLEIQCSASEKQIKRAYRDLCKHCHPDLNRSPEANARMQGINEAYRVLSSPLKRAEYDQLLRLLEQQAKANPDRAPDSGPTDLCSCEKCGRADATLRATVFTWVISLLLITYRRGWARILCARCRTKYALVFGLQNFFMGWWGIPYGVFWTLEALWHNSMGGQQPKENNALFLAGLGYELHRKGDVSAAVKALEASLRFKKNPRVEAFFRQANAKLNETQAGVVHEPRPSLWQRFAAGSLHPALYCTPVLALLFWLGYLFVGSETKTPVRARSAAAVQQWNSYEGMALPPRSGDPTPDTANERHAAKADSTPGPNTGSASGDVVLCTPEQEAEYWEGAGMHFFEAHDYAGALQPLKSAAMAGRAKAQYYLGWCYLRGTGVKKDAGEAVKWLQKAGGQGVAGAESWLGCCYYNGEGATKDAVGAVKWWQKAAEQGEALAQFNLGGCYFNGDGVMKDPLEAERWFRRAAAAGLARAQFMVGRCLLPDFNGEGAKDVVEAVKWYRKAAEQGYAAAQVRLGAYYSQGLGVTKNAAEAVKWYRKAAEQGDATAQVNLGWCYADGDGVPKDYVAAYKWLNLSSAQDILGARQRLPEVEQLMTPWQIAEAQKLAREFKPRAARTPDSTSRRESIEDFPPSGSGTGFFITEDGFLITNEHVAGESSQIRLFTGMGLIPARVVKVDAANDLALLKANGKFVPLPVAASRTVRVGSTVATIGFPNIGLQGFAPKLAKGEIAALSGAQDDARYFQISVPVQPGNSGGGLVDDRGNVVGIVSAKLSAKAALVTSGALPENVNYAVKSSFLLSFLESVPEVSAKLREPCSTKERKFEDVVKEAQEAAVLVLAY